MMNRRKSLTLFLFGLAFALFLLISGLRWLNPVKAQPQTTLLISAAASLRDALGAIAPPLSKSIPGSE